ncbi:MAG: hypothetical protein ACRD3E_02295 [Terriglobales bacterium]
MNFLEYVYNLNLEALAHGSNGVLHKHETSFVEVARNRLTAAGTCEDTRKSIREIVANLVGCEEFALYEVDYRRAVMWPRWSFGVHADLQRAVDLIAYPELNPALQGQVTVYTSPKRLDCFPDAVSALVPIACHDSRLAVLVLFGLLPQKSALNETDNRLLEVLSLHGGRALMDAVTSFSVGGK